MTTLRITDARGRVWHFHDVASGKKGGAANPAQVRKASCNDAVKRTKAVLQPTSNVIWIRKPV
jgi:hypothetical protein